MSRRMNEFSYETKEHVVVQWYKDEGGEIMANNVKIIENILNPGGKPTPGFARFVAPGSVLVETCFGERPVSYNIPLSDATTLSEAAAMIEEMDKEIQPAVIRAAKEEAIELYKQMQNKIAVPGAPGQAGPSGIVIPGG